jgi:hypothetical protein
LITNKLSAFGVSVVVAFAAVLVLLVASPLTASADKSITAGGSTTIANIATGDDRLVTVTSTHQSGTELCTEGVFTLVANKTVGGTATIADADCGNRTTTVTVAMTTTATSMAVASTTGFPDSGSAIIAVINTLGGGGVTEEIVDYTSKTTTTLDGLTRKRAGTPAVAHIIGRNVYPVVYSTVTIAASTAALTTVNLADASGFVAGTGPELIFAPGVDTTQAPENVTAKSGNTLTFVPHGLTLALGTYVAQVSAVNKDSATVTFTRTASTTTSGSFQFISTAGSEASVKGTQSITLITDKPDANAAAATVSATEPVAIPVLVSLTGTDLTEVADTASFDLTILPTKGILGAIGAAVCTDVGTAATRVVGSAMTNCTSMVTYTPLLGATGSDTFSFTFTNGAEKSVAAVGTITLPAAPVVVAAPTLTGGFAATLSTGVNLTTYGGGTVAELDADGVAAGATSISVTIDGAFIVYVVSAPEFVNAAFNAQYPTSVANGTVVLVVK